ncbi:MAG: hypothetical protein J6A59_09735 [Lachnospiraceae bacterium]|nr:hypothetical protein [Lachnospiraceae bacterium]
MNIDVSMTKEFIEVVDYICEKFGIVVDWSNGELVPYLQSLMDKIVDYKSGIAWLWITVAIVCVIAAIVCFIYDHCNGDGGWSVLGFLLAITAITVAIVNAYTLVTCNTFPEKIVFDYIETVMQNKSL